MPPAKSFFDHHPPRLNFERQALVLSYSNGFSSDVRPICGRQQAQHGP